MRRRAFLTGAAATTAITAPAIAQSLPEMRWRLTSSFPRALDIIFGAATTLSKIVAEATDNRFQIQVFPAGEIVPGLQALDAVSNATVEMCHTASAYYVGKNPSFAFGSVVPFALNARGMNAWYWEGGGKQLLDAFYAKHNVVHLLGGNTGCQMAGWFRKEIKSVADLKGLKFRIPGLQGRVLAKLGVVPQQIAAGDIYPSLERGTIDAAEWVGPYDDEKLGFVRIAPFYYYPGWWEGGPAINFFIGQEKWQALPPAYRAILSTAAETANAQMLQRYDARNPAALKRLVGLGAQLRPFPPDVMEACYQASEALLKETAADDPVFAGLCESLTAFRDEQYLWWRVAEANFDIFMMRQRR
jgi:TRAP-type mannitol/chloroaromatic compound transport system substrate-binding protein